MKFSVVTVAGVNRWGGRHLRAFVHCFCLFRQVALFSDPDTRSFTVTMATYVC